MTETVAAGQLRAIIERIERVEAEIHELNADKSEIYKEARGFGFDVKAVRQCVAARKLDSAEREERNAMFDLYWSALQGSVHVPTRTRENIEQFPLSSVPTPSPETTDSPAPGSLQASGNHLSQIAAVNTDHAQTDDAVQSGDESTAPLSDDVPAFLLKDRPPLRPLCLNPTVCAGYGTHTCHRCLTAAGRSEVAA